MCSIGKFHVPSLGDEPEIVGLGNIVSGPGFLEQLRDMLKKQRRNGKQPSRIIIGDLRDLEHEAERAGMVSAIRIAAWMLRVLNIPLILFESSGTAGATTPMALALANVGIKIDVSSEGTKVMSVYDLTESLQMQSEIQIKKPSFYQARHKVTRP